jgi:hypothetical protein
VLVVGIGAGCGGSSRSVLDEGVSLRGVQGGVHRIDDEQALSVVRHARAEWERELMTRAHTFPGQQFQNLQSAVLRARLDALARTYDFEVREVDLLRPRPGQVAPAVVVRTRHYLLQARATHSILHLLDPKRPTRDDRTGWRYEGFYFEAQDEDGVPFLAAYNFMRGQGPGGGQWARSERLYPFEHG